MSLGVPGRDLPPIPGVVFHPIESWVEPGYPMSGPAFPNPGDIVVVFIHYPGGGTAPMTVDAMDARMRSMNRDYLTNREPPYSLGYGFVVPIFGTGNGLEGHVWEGRGVRFRNAANAGGKVSGNANTWSVSIQIAVSGADAATDVALRAASAIVGWLRDLGMQVVIGYHEQVDWTPCAGAGIIPQVQAGLVEPDVWGYPFTTPEPEPEPEGAKMSALEHTRHYDSRTADQGEPLWAGGRYTFGPFTANGVPAEATGVVVNLTTTGADGVGWLAAFPGTSVSNFAPDEQRASVNLIKLDGSGRFTLEVAGLRTDPREGVHLAIDVQGYSTG